MTEKKAPDWERIETEYRAGVLSVREIAATHSISHTAINKRAKAEGWERDLQAKIQAKAEALVSKREVSSQVSTETAATERQVIEANAMRIADVRLAHRSDIRRNRELTTKLLQELEGQTENADILDELGELMRREDDKGVDRLNEIYRKVISLPQRVDSMKKLADTLKTLVELERKAYGLDADDKGKGVNPLDKLSPEDVDARIAELERKLGRA